jgi:radical SAM protein with 4Fe4S-binding SPASM domain
MDEKALSQLAVHRFLISCPSADPALYAKITGVGDYERFERRLRLVIESGISHTVNMVVSTWNVHDVRRTARRMAELGVRQFAATPASINARSPRYDLSLSRVQLQETLNDLVWIYEELGMAVDVMEALPKCVIPHRALELRLPFVYRSCQAGRRNGTISPLGDVRPCGHNPMVYGNVLRDEWDDIWTRMRTWREATGNHYESCLGCDWFNSCGGGCRIDAAIVNGRADAPHPYMIEPQPLINIEPPVPPLTAETVVRRSKIFLSRPEENGWLVSSGSSRNILYVNGQLFRFLDATRHDAPATLAAIAHRFGTTCNDPSFLRVMSRLIQRSFFIVVDTDVAHPVLKTSPAPQFQTCSKVSVQMRDYGILGPPG